MLLRKGVDAIDENALKGPTQRSPGQGSASAASRAAALGRHHPPGGGRALTCKYHRHLTEAAIDPRIGYVLGYAPMVGKVFRSDEFQVNRITQGGVGCRCAMPDLPWATMFCPYRTVQ